MAIFSSDIQQQIIPELLSGNGASPYNVENNFAELARKKQGNLLFLNQYLGQNNINPDTHQDALDQMIKMGGTQIKSFGEETPQGFNHAVQNYNTSKKEMGFSGDVPPGSDSKKSGVLDEILEKIKGEQGQNKTYSLFGKNSSYDNEQKNNNNVPFEEQKNPGDHLNQDINKIFSESTEYQNGTQRIFEGDTENNHKIDEALEEIKNNPKVKDVNFITTNRETQKITNESESIGQKKARELEEEFKKLYKNYFNIIKINKDLSFNLNNAEKKIKKETGSLSLGAKKNKNKNLKEKIKILETEYKKIKKVRKEISDIEKRCTTIHNRSFDLIQSIKEGLDEIYCNKNNFFQHDAMEESLKKTMGFFGNDVKRYESYINEIKNKKLKILNEHNNHLNAVEENIYSLEQGNNALFTLVTEENKKLVTLHNFLNNQNL